MINLEDLILEAPFSYLAIQQLHIHQRISHHAHAELKLLLADDEGTAAINQLDHESVFTVKTSSGILFTGYLFNASLKTVNQIYVLTVSLVSASYHMDIKNKKRSFQDVKQTYTDLFQTIAQEYGNSLGSITESQAKGAALIQYQETDWQFLNRIASLANTVVYSDPRFTKPSLHFGIHSSRSYHLEQKNYTVRLDYQEFLYKQAAGISDNQYHELVYQIETAEPYQLGDQVIYQGANLIVAEKETYLTNAVVQHQYSLKAVAGISSIPYFNNTARGVSILGTVLAVKNDQVKIHLAIDQMQDLQKAAWYSFESPYTGADSGGWYCMPQIGDQVLLYLAAADERTAVVRSASRTDRTNQRIQEPSRKSMGTIYGNEMALSPMDITFSEIANRMYLKLNQQTGVELSSSKNIVLQSDTVGLECKILEIVSNDKIVMATNTASVITDQVIHMKGV